MGRFIVLIVGAGILGVSLLTFNSQKAKLETKGQQDDYQYQVIARDIVMSGFDQGLSAIKRDRMDVATSFPQATVDDGYYDLEVTKNFYGDASINVTAHSGDAAYDMEGKIVFSAPFPAALMLEDDGIAVNGTGFYQVSGVDRRMPSQATRAGFENPGRGIMTTASHLDALTASLQANNIVGIGSQPTDPVNEGSIVSGFDEVYIEALYQEAILEAHSVLSADPEGNVNPTALISAMSSSGPGVPKIVRAMGNVNLTESLTGYGMLIIEDGDLNVYTDLHWEGLILVRKVDRDTVWVNLNNSTIYGGLVAYDANNGSSQTIECVPDFTIDGDDIVVQDSFRVSIEVLGAAISYNGTYDMPVTAQIDIGGQAYEPWGSYDLALDGNINTGNSGVTYSWEPETIFPARSTISINARSWVKQEGQDGDQNNEWNTFMTATSSGANSPQIYALEDGSTVPSVGGFMGQFSVMDFLAPYLSGTTMVLDANQATNLFELGMTDTESEAFDLQDLVVMVTLTDATSNACYVAGAPSMLDVDLKNDTELHYSSEAIAKLGLYLDTIRDATNVHVAWRYLRGQGAGEILAFDGTGSADDGEDTESLEGVPVEERVSICHNGNALTIPQQALLGHIGHGDNLDSCQ